MIRPIALVCTAAVVAGAASASAQQAAAAGRSPSESRARQRTDTPQGFSVVLVLGDITGAAAPDNVPPAARKALADMKDFLPFKSYHLLDVQWTLCCSRTPIASRLRAEQGEYEVELSPSMSETDGKIHVRFVLQNADSTDSAAVAASSLIATLTQQQQVLQLELAELRNRYTERHSSVVRKREQIQEVTRRLETVRRGVDSGRVARSASSSRPTAQSPRRGALIDTSFTMDVGETVVVGTSRVRNGEKALIALLTAVPPKGTAGQR